ncbi:hypothetical protein SDJN02_23729, partial [Cucurbita argyrosperma subsp. argyrosperma]
MVAFAQMVTDGSVGNGRSGYLGVWVVHLIDRLLQWRNLVSFDVSSLISIPLFSRDSAISVLFWERDEISPHV